MRFFTKSECEEWLSGRSRQKPDSIPGICSERVSYPQEAYRYYDAAQSIAQNIANRLPTLLWVTEWGIWPSSENWHLYYKLRQSHADHRLLYEAPGHFFLEYEAEELTSFLQLSMLNGWGGYVLPHASDVSAFFSHDEYIEFFAERNEQLANVRGAFP